MKMCRERQHTVKDHFKGLIERMLNEEKGEKRPINNVFPTFKMDIY